MRKLNFSCGNDIREGWDNCDHQISEKVYFCDANRFPYPFFENTYDHVEMRQCIQLFDDVRKVLFEIWRITKPNGTIHINTAYFGNHGACCDVDTRHFFNEDSFIKFLEHNCRIEEKDMFELIKQEITPTKLTKYFPEWLRRRLSRHIFGVYEKILIDLRVLK